MLDLLVNSEIFQQAPIKREILPDNLFWLQFYQLCSLGEKNVKIAFTYSLINFIYLQ